MRLDQTPDNIAHAAWLLDVGAGKNLGPEETVQVPETMICNDNSVTGLISSTYPYIDHHQDDQYYLDCTILSGKNSDVEDINSEVLQKCPGEEKILQNADSIISDDGNSNGLALSLEYKDLTEQSEVGSGMKQELQARAEGTDRGSSNSRRRCFDDKGLDLS
ncbi:hypothetical protein E4T56_gene5325 [Termitomyces sp. T112]|nr:hypothetical protein E4T56_gene5325 [Termitomyces sp. T112]